MRIVIDACVDPRVAGLLPQHDVATLFDLGLNRLMDHDLIGRLSGKCDVFLTIDRGFAYQHNLLRIPFAIIVVRVTRNKVEFFTSLLPRILDAIARARPGTATMVSDST